MSRKNRGPNLWQHQSLAQRQTELDEAFQRLAQERKGQQTVKITFQDVVRRIRKLFQESEIKLQPDDLDVIVRAIADHRRGKTWEVFQGKPTVMQMLVHLKYAIDHVLSEGAVALPLGYQLDPSEEASQSRGHTSNLPSEPSIASTPKTPQPAVDPPAEAPIASTPKVTQPAIDSQPKASILTLPPMAAQPIDDTPRKTAPVIVQPPHVERTTNVVATINAVPVAKTQFPASNSVAAPLTSPNRNRERKHVQRHQQPAAAAVSKRVPKTQPPPENTVLKLGDSNGPPNPPEPDAALLAKVRGLQGEEAVKVLLSKAKDVDMKLLGLRSRKGEIKWPDFPIPMEKALGKLCAVWSRIPGALQYFGQTYRCNWENVAHWYTTIGWTDDRQQNTEGDPKLAAVAASQSAPETPIPEDTAPSLTHCEGPPNPPEPDMALLARVKSLGRERAVSVLLGEATDVDMALLLEHSKPGPNKWEIYPNSMEMALGKLCAVWARIPGALKFFCRTYRFNWENVGRWYGTIGWTAPSGPEEGQKPIDSHLDSVLVASILQRLDQSAAVEQELMKRQISIEELLLRVLVNLQAQQRSSASQKQIDSAPVSDLVESVGTANNDAVTHVSVAPEEQMGKSLHERELKLLEDAASTEEEEETVAHSVIEAGGAEGTLVSALPDLVAETDHVLLTQELALLEAAFSIPEKLPGYTHRPELHPDMVLIGLRILQIVELLPGHSMRQFLLSHGLYPTTKKRWMNRCKITDFLKSIDVSHLVAGVAELYATAAEVGEGASTQDNALEDAATDQSTNLTAPELSLDYKARLLEELSSLEERFTMPKFVGVRRELSIYMKMIGLRIFQLLALLGLPMNDFLDKHHLSSNTKANWMKACNIKDFSQPIDITSAVPPAELSDSEVILWKEELKLLEAVFFIPEYVPGQKRKELSDAMKRIGLRIFQLYASLGLQQSSFVEKYHLSSSKSNWMCTLGILDFSIPIDVSDLVPGVAKLYATAAKVEEEAVGQDVSKVDRVTPQLDRETAKPSEVADGMIDFAAMQRELDSLIALIALMKSENSETYLQSPIAQHAILRGGELCAKLPGGSKRRFLLQYGVTYDIEAQLRMQLGLGNEEISIDVSGILASADKPVSISETAASGKEDTREEQIDELEPVDQDVTEVDTVLRQELTQLEAAFPFPTYVSGKRRTPSKDTMLIGLRIAQLYKLIKGLHIADFVNRHHLADSFQKNWMRACEIEDFSQPISVEEALRNVTEERKRSHSDTNDPAPSNEPLSSPKRMEHRDSKPTIPPRMHEPYVPTVGWRSDRLETGTFRLPTAIQSDMTGSDERVKAATNIASVSGPDEKQAKAYEKTAKDGFDRETRLRILREIRECAATFTSTDTNDDKDAKRAQQRAYQDAILQRENIDRNLLMKWVNAYPASLYDGSAQVSVAPVSSGQVSSTKELPEAPTQGEQLFATLCAFLLSPKATIIDHNQRTLPDRLKVGWDKQKSWKQNTFLSQMQDWNAVTFAEFMELDEINFARRSPDQKVRWNELYLLKMGLVGLRIVRHEDDAHAFAYAMQRCCSCVQAYMQRVAAHEDAVLAPDVSRQRFFSGIEDADEDEDEDDEETGGSVFENTSQHLFPSIQVEANHDEKMSDAAIVDALQHCRSNDPAFLEDYMVAAQLTQKFFGELGR